MSWEIRLAGTGLLTAEIVRVNEAGVLRAWKKAFPKGALLEPAPDVIYAPQAWLSVEQKS